MPSKPPLPPFDCPVPLDRPDPRVEIRVKGRLDDTWSDWFLGLAVTHEEEDETILSGPVVDQAALYGLVSRLRDLGVALLSVTLSEEEMQEPEHKAAVDCSDENPGADSPAPDRQ